MEGHSLDLATQVDYPPGAPMKIRRCLVVHFTAGASARSSIDWWRDPGAKGAEAHIVIARNGEVIQIRKTNQRADHAGRSRWVDPNTGKIYNWINSCSIGIELANGGDSPSIIKRFSNLPPVRARHRNGGALKDWEAYPEAQFEALCKVADALVKRYNLDDITGHDCVSPGRKPDPGPAFKMQELRKYCGFSGLPKVAKK